MSDETYAPQWAARWPERITLDEAAEEISFDVFQGDPEGTILLVKVLVPVAGLVTWTLEALADNDSEDRTGRLEDGLLAGGGCVPPVVILPSSGLADGNHRVALAEQGGRAHVPAYVVPVVDANGDEVSLPPGFILHDGFREHAATQVPAPECGHYMPEAEVRGGRPRCASCNGVTGEAS
ncbi:hypothetical protein E1091_00235 [Micromonospora fluostatini]|uniref:Uncharacterized protein n=1 Tax=Micromonospora fluostatini TaxID=1629071 RepID=A0ABY2DPI9_9ACTN|nr:hypothetical protein E1091_00235 [Micromonospora fluostatini]